MSVHLVLATTENTHLVTGVLAMLVGGPLLLWGAIREANNRDGGNFIAMIGVAILAAGLVITKFLE